MKKIISICNFLAVVMLAFAASFAVGAVVMYFTQDVNDLLDATIFGGLLLSMWLGALD